MVVLAELVKDADLPARDEHPAVHIPAGTTVRIVMMSRFGIFVD